MGWKERHASFSPTKIERAAPPGRFPDGAARFFKMVGALINVESLPLNYTLYLIFRELAIIGDIYRGQYKQRTPP